MVYRDTPIWKSKSVTVKAALTVALVPPVPFMVIVSLRFTVVLAKAGSVNAVMRANVSVSTYTRGRFSLKMFYVLS